MIVVEFKLERIELDEGGIELNGIGCWVDDWKPVTEATLLYSSLT